MQTASSFMDLCQTRYGSEGGGLWARWGKLGGGRRYGVGWKGLTLEANLMLDPIPNFPTYTVLFIELVGMDPRRSIGSQNVVSKNHFLLASHWDFDCLLIACSVCSPWQSCMLWSDRKKTWAVNCY